MRKAEIKAGLARINADISDIDRGVDPGAHGSMRAMEQEAAVAPPAPAPKAPEPVVERVVVAPKDDRAEKRKSEAPPPVAPAPAPAVKARAASPPPVDPAAEEDTEGDGGDDLPIGMAKKRNELITKVALPRVVGWLRCQVLQDLLQVRSNSSDTKYLLTSFRKPPPPQNRQHNTLTRNNYQ
jgi:hypothetical protein